MRDYAAEGLSLLGKMHELCCSIISEDNFLSIWRSTRFPDAPMAISLKRSILPIGPKVKTGIRAPG